MSVERLEIIKQQIIALSRQEQAELSQFLAKQMEQDNLNSAVAPAPPGQAELDGIEAAESRLVNYDPGLPGISVDVSRSLVGVSVTLEAKLDTGSTNCVFERDY